LTALWTAQSLQFERHLHVLLHHPQVADAAVLAAFLCVKQRPGGHCVAGDVVADGRRRRRRRRGARRDTVTAVAEADTDEQTDSGRQERPENSVEDRPAVDGRGQHGSRLDVPRVVETRGHWLTTRVRLGVQVQLATEIVDAFTIPQRVTGALVQRALQHTQQLAF